MEAQTPYYRPPFWLAYWQQQRKNLTRIIKPAKVTLWADLMETITHDGPDQMWPILKKLKKTSRVITPSVLHADSATLIDIVYIAHTLLHHFCPSIEAEEFETIQMIDEDVEEKMTHIPALFPDLISVEELQACMFGRTRLAPGLYGISMLAIK